MDEVRNAEDSAHNVACVRRRRSLFYEQPHDVAVFLDRSKFPMLNLVLAKPEFLRELVDLAGQKHQKLWMTVLARELLLFRAESDEFLPLPIKVGGSHGDHLDTRAVRF